MWHLPALLVGLYSNVIFSQRLSLTVPFKFQPPVLISGTYLALKQVSSCNTALFDTGAMGATYAFKKMIVADFKK